MLKERKLGIIEASMELLTWRSYAVRPSVVNFRLSLPNERFLKLMPFNTIRDKIKEINDNEEVIEDLEDESIQGLFNPNIWENYMARNNELENITFSEMVMEYKWWSSLANVPAYCKKLLQNEFIYNQQWSFSELIKYRESQDRLNDLEESFESKEIRRHQSKICLDDKSQLARYWYKKKSKSMFNCIYKMKKDKDELYFFILLIDYVPFRSF